MAKLPKDLTELHIRKAVDYVEKEAAELVDLYCEQANIFSGIVGILGVRALHAVNPYKKHKHPDVAQQRFPDLSLQGKLNPPPTQALESKGSIRPWAIQSHYDHPGWYVVWRYMVDPTESIKQGRPVVVWRVDVVFLDKSDWKYEGSKAGAGGGGRTHTFGVANAAKKLADAATYQNPSVALEGGKPIMTEAVDNESAPMRRERSTINLKNCGRQGDMLPFTSNASQRYLKFSGQSCGASEPTG